MFPQGQLKTLGIPSISSDLGRATYLLVLTHTAKFTEMTAAEFTSNKGPVLFERQLPVFFHFWGSSPCHQLPSSYLLLSEVPIRGHSIASNAWKICTRISANFKTRVWLTIKTSSQEKRWIIFSSHQNQNWPPLWKMCFNHCGPLHWNNGLMLTGTCDEQEVGLADLMVLPGCELWT